MIFGVYAGLEKAMKRGESNPASHGRLALAACLFLCLFSARYAFSQQAGAIPQTPGHHRLFFKANLDEKPIDIAYAVFLPSRHQAKKVLRPMIVFMMGSGERGSNHDGIYVHGPAAEIKRDKGLAEWADFIVLSPQCPPDMRWDSPGLARVVVDLIRQAAVNWRADPTRIYLTGLSMGGVGCWRVALEAGGGFAAMAVFSAEDAEPENVAKAVRGTTVWIIAGTNDGGIIDGSRKMAKALHDANVDVLLTEVPDAEHVLWGPFYSSRGFYEFLLMHRFGLRPPANRPTGKELLELSKKPPDSVDARLAGQFKEFLPYWQLLNCGADLELGLREEFNGKKRVFVTHPLAKDTPCRMMTTISVPKGRKPELILTVGHHPQGDWDLVVRANGREIFRKPVGKSTAVNGWMDVKINLSAYAGRDVLIEMLNQPTGWQFEAAYWARVEVRHGD